MGKDHAAGQVDTTQLHHAIKDIAVAHLWADYYQTLAPFLTALKKRVKDEELNLPAFGEVATIFDGLQAFEGNRQLYFKTEADQLPLKKHLAFTIMVPGGRAVRARLALQNLTGAGFWDADCQLTSQDLLELIKPYVRFPNQKTERLWEARQIWPRMLAQINGTADDALRGIDPLHRLDAIRAWLIDHVPGLSNKASAHFMRNTGLFSFQRGFPIIDVHIYKALKAFNFRDNGYEDAEPSFEALSDMVGVPVIALDAILWCVFSGSWDPGELDFGNFEEKAQE